MWLVVLLSLSEPKMCHLLPFSRSHYTRHVCQFHSEQTFNLPFLFFFLLTVFSESEGQQICTNDTLLFKTDSACSDSSKSKVMSSSLPHVSHKSLISFVFAVFIFITFVLTMLFLICFRRACGGQGRISVAKRCCAPPSSPAASVRSPRTKLNPAVQTMTWTLCTPRRSSRRRASSTLCGPQTAGPRRRGRQMKPVRKRSTGTAQRSSSTCPAGKSLSLAA